MPAPVHGTFTHDQTEKRDEQRTSEADKYAQMRRPDFDYCTDIGKKQVGRGVPAVKCQAPSRVFTNHD